MSPLITVLFACTGSMDDTSNAERAPEAPGPEAHLDAAPSDATADAAPRGRPAAPAEWRGWSPGDSAEGFPAFAMAPVSSGLSLSLEGAPGSLSMDPLGRTLAWTLDGALYVWALEGAPVEIPLPEGAAREVAFDPFGGGLFLLSEGETWRVERFPFLDAGLGAPELYYESAQRLSSLVVSFVLYDMRKRVFFSLGEDGERRIVSAMEGAARAYEITSPDGAISALTTPDLIPEDPSYSDIEAPNLSRAVDAAACSLNPATGDLIWSEGGDLWLKPWRGYNWEDARDSGLDGACGIWSPNAWYQVTWGGPARGAALIAPDGSVAQTFDVPFVAAPIFSPDGRTLIGVAGEEGDLSLRALSVTAPLAAARFLDRVSASTQGKESWSSARARALSDLEARGVALSDGWGEQIYNHYESMFYNEIGTLSPPIFASIDGSLEVLHAGFQAVFMLREAELSRPRLGAFLDALIAAGPSAAVASAAEIARKMMAGDYEHPEGQLVLAEQKAYSEVLGREVAFADFHPRGPYTRVPELSNYFRAFKYVDQIVLPPEDVAKLSADAALMDAWRGWVEVQASFMSGSRKAPALDSDRALPAHVRADCVPTRVRQAPARLFPLSWGIDSEILESVVWRRGVAADCMVTNRLLPSGLDLMAGLGAPEALSLLKGEYAIWPELEPAHAQLRERFGAPLGPSGVVQSWLGLIQSLGQSEHTPSGVAPEIWRRRLMETALASWTAFRHTTVLINEGGAAEAGGGWFGFEELYTEPPRGAVDPVPESWDRLAGLMASLAEEAGEDNAGIAETLQVSAERSRAFGDMARRQMKGEALTIEEYGEISAYVRAIEHPFLKLQSAGAEQMGMPAPEPMAKIVDVQRSGSLEGLDPDLLASLQAQHPELRGLSEGFWHAAIGRPQEIIVLLDDRGVQVPAHGSIYSYYEVVGDAPMDDDAWREALEVTPRLEWTARALQDR